MQIVDRHKRDPPDHDAQHRSRGARFNTAIPVSRWPSWICGSTTGSSAAAGRQRSSTYATTDGSGRFGSDAIFPGRYVIDINDNDFPGSEAYSKIGMVRRSQRHARRRKSNSPPRSGPICRNRCQIRGTAVGDDGKSMVYGGMGCGSSATKQTPHPRRRHRAAANILGLGFGPVGRDRFLAHSTYGIGTHDVELFGYNTRFGYTLVRRTPAEPLRITDDPNKPEVEDGIRYIRPHEPVEFELAFAKKEPAPDKSK